MPVRRSFLMVLLLLFMFSLTAQEWAPPGTRWYYSQYYFNPNIGVHVTEVIGDTIINGQNCRVLDNAESCSLPIRFAYQEDRRIYYYNKYTEDFHLLYDFNLTAGDTLKMFVKENESLPDTFYVKIDSVGQVFLNEDTIQVQYVTTLYELNNELSFGNKIYENIGGNNFFLPVYGFCDIPAMPLRCYEDPNRGLYQFITEFPCDYVPVEEPDGSVSLTLQPNPASDRILISSPELITALEVIDLNGRRSLQQSGLHDFTHSLEVQNLSPGIYFLRIFLLDKRTSIQKFIRR